MKKFPYILFLLLSFYGFAQDYNIPEIPFETSLQQENKLFGLLGLKDTTALIVHIGYSRHPVIELMSDYIVYLRDGKVHYYKVSWRINNESFWKKKRMRIKKDKLPKYWKFLSNCVSEDKFKIDQIQLELIGEKANAMKQAITGGQTSYFGLYQGKNHIEYNSFLPTMFSSEEYPGFKEKRKLVKLMKGFESLLEKE